jgi:hypothetical protein
MAATARPDLQRLCMKLSPGIASAGTPTRPKRPIISLLVPGNCTRKMAVATRVGPGSIFAIPTPVKHTSSMSARETLRAVAFFAAAFYSKLRQPDDAAKEPHPRHSESRKLAAFQARRRKQNPGRTCYPFGFGGSPGFAASPGFGGAPPAGAPPGRSSSAGIASISGSANEFG